MTISREKFKSIHGIFIRLGLSAGKTRDECIEVLLAAPRKPEYVDREYAEQMVDEIMNSPRVIEQAVHDARKKGITD